jgi:hypothetical protein
MGMDPSLLIQMIGAAIGGALLYALIGVIPGTDETAVLAPIFLAFALLGMEPRVLLCCFISAIVAKKINRFDSRGSRGNSRWCDGRTDGALRRFPKE